MATTDGVTRNPVAGFSKKSLGELAHQLFPAVKCPLSPCANRILVQIASPLAKSDGGIIIPEDVKDVQKWTQKLAKVIELGPLAYKDRETGKPWPEGNWVNVGDFIRVGLYGGDRTEIPAPDGGIALFATIADREVFSKIKEGFDPMTLKEWF
jgi:co-chaperonin GroES (HSP10)